MWAASTPMTWVEPGSGPMGNASVIAQRSMTAPNLSRWIVRRPACQGQRRARELRPSARTRYSGRRRAQSLVRATREQSDGVADLRAGRWAVLLAPSARRGASGPLTARRPDPCRCLSDCSGPGFAQTLDGHPRSPHPPRASRDVDGGRRRRVPYVKRFIEWPWS